MGCTKLEHDSVSDCSTADTAETISARASPKIVLNLQDALESATCNSSTSNTTPHGPNGQYCIVLDNTTCVSLGVDIKCCNDLLLITAIIPGGLVEAWNDYEATHMDNVVVGDCIIEANGVQGDAQQLLDECKKSKILKITLQRRPPLSFGDAAVPPYMLAPAVPCWPWLPSIGSAYHNMGMCKPCGFLHKGGCANAMACKFCHICGPDELKQRKKDKKLAKQAVKSFKIQMNSLIGDA